MYAVQAVFRSSRLDPKLSEIRIFNDLEDVINYLKTEKDTIEFDLSTSQPPKFRREIALHWARKGCATEEQTRSLINWVATNDYTLPFTFLKISVIQDKGRIGKMKNALLINNNIYYVKDLDDGVFNTVIQKVC